MIIAGFGEPVVNDVLIEGCSIYGDVSKGSNSGLVMKDNDLHGFDVIDDPTMP